MSIIKYILFIIYKTWIKIFINKDLSVSFFAGWSIIKVEKIILFIWYILFISFALNQDYKSSLLYFFKECIVLSHKTPKDEQYLINLV